MAKKRRVDVEEQQRQSRKEILLARRQERQTRQIRLAILGVLGFLIIIVAVGLVNELVIKPQQPVAVVNGQAITMGEWRDRVRFQRAQIVLGLEDLATTFGGDVGLVQQYAGQQINLLLDPPTLGQVVLDEMIDQELIRQGAEARGIRVTDEDVQKAIEEQFSFFGGLSPTPLPTASATVQPTPSLTPIPTEVITEVVPTNTPLPTPTLGPTSTPRPTSTPVSQEAFQEDYQEMISRFGSYGVSEETYRAVIRAQLYEERLTEELAVDAEVTDEAEQASLYYIAFESEEEAQETLEAILDGEYLTIWNTIRSRPPDPESESTATAGELLWRSQNNYESFLGEEVANAAFELPLDEPSDILVQPGAATAEGEEAPDRYFIIQVSGREIRPLSESEISSAEQTELAEWLEGQRINNVETFDRWRANVPTQPVLDPSFLVQPTQAPPQPTIPVEIPEELPTSAPATTEPAAEPTEGS
ncbi:MAG: SurA N-terminal domain-containing protein [Chloroflexi bacterium]|nr:SurA N-terminal domain-containing protein [Chloroflexota bacterium]MCI0580038.1 SurA N-terminal domain-containing protein [Chloroflexota bacterium]MCI0646767.1 SurA N-terminal domain-containing protein [Chloroflexota bacterium]MCI0730205.1 SurA N-terminal domain-containing protein [Chloroflexota bacterium]